MNKDEHSIDESNAAEVYLRQISQYKLLSNDATMELFKRYWKGEQQAFSLIAEGHLQLVIKNASYFIDCGIPIEDLIQEGNIGLLSAISRFKEVHEGPFVSYANLCIFQSMKDAKDTLSNIIRFPSNQLEKHKAVQKFKDVVEKMVGFRPSLDMVFDGSNDASKKDSEIISYYDELPENLGDICEIQDLDSIEDISQYTDATNSLHDIESYLKVLSEREKYILENLFSGESLSSIGRELNISRERVRQIVVSSEKKIKSYVESLKVKPETKNSKKATSNKVLSSHTYSEPTPIHEAFGFGSIPKILIKQVPVTNRENLHSEHVDVHHEPVFGTNDYDLLSQKLQEKISKQEKLEKTDSETVEYKDEINTTQGSKAVSYKGISVGDTIKFDTSVYIVDVKVLDINIKQKKLVIQYKNGVIDYIDLGQIQIIHRGAIF